MRSSINSITSFLSDILSHLKKGRLPFYYFYRRLKLGTINWFCDFYYGIKTREVFNVTQMKVESKNLEHAVRYEGTPYFILKEIFNSSEVDLKGRKFLDIGCGRGRALFWAHQKKASKIMGVDFSSDLCLEAQKNLEGINNVSIYCQDISDFELAEKFDVIYISNPFGKVVLENLLDKDWIKNQGPETVFVYHVPLESSSFLNRNYKLSKTYSYFRNQDVVKVFRKPHKDLSSDKILYHL